MSEINHMFAIDRKIKRTKEKCLSACSWTSDEMSLEPDGQVMIETSMNLVCSRRHISPRGVIYEN